MTTIHKLALAVVTAVGLGAAAHSAELLRKRCRRCGHDPARRRVGEGLEREARRAVHTVFFPVIQRQAIITGS